jgi:Pyridoxamine 5'-phosphate oxidase
MLQYEHIGGVSQVPASTSRNVGRGWVTSRHEMTPGECVAYLARGAVGRIIYIDGALPEVVPVSYRVAGNSVVFGVETSSPLARQLPGSVVTFQADSFDPEHESGWHVRAVGVIGTFLLPEEMAVAGTILPPPWPVGARAVDLVVQVRLTAVSGHVVEISEAAP